MAVQQLSQCLFHIMQGFEGLCMKKTDIFCCVKQQTYIFVILMWSFLFSNTSVGKRLMLVALKAMLFFMMQESILVFTKLYSILSALFSVWGDRRKYKLAYYLFNQLIIIIDYESSGGKCLHLFSTLHQLNISALIPLAVFRLEKRKKNKDMNGSIKSF